MYTSKCKHYTYINKLRRDRGPKIYKHQQSLSFPKKTSVCEFKLSKSVDN